MSKAKRSEFRSQVQKSRLGSGVEVKSKTCLHSWNSGIQMTKEKKLHISKDLKAHLRNWSGKIETRQPGLKVTLNHPTGAKERCPSHRWTRFGE